VRVLITGASGFAGRHLTRLAAERGASVTALGRRERPEPAIDGAAGYLGADLTGADEARAAVRESQPEWIFHLAAEASVAESWRRPQEVIEHNLRSSLNLLEAVQAEAPDARVVIACSGEEYGPVASERLPVTEEEPLRPQNPYAVSKASVDMLAGLYAGARGLTVLRARSFNHAGPGQSTAYVVASFARQMAAAERDGASEVEIVTGNTAPRRDFTDVRDVTAAYWAMAELAPPDAYNVCSGASVAVADILTGLARHTELEVRQRTDPGLLREHEVMEIRGSHDKLTGATGWQPAIPLERTLADTLDWWRGELGA
jgi:GDP-4-dehydro-6-deoxy-D-mannose reductase